MSRKMKWVILALMVIGCAMTGCGKEEVVVEAEMTPAQMKQQEMSDAAYYNSFVVVFNKAIDEGDVYAICNGTSRIVGLDKGETRRVELSSQEALNASLCKHDAGTGNYSFVQDISGVNPGDWLEWGESSFGITRYTP